MTSRIDTSKLSGPSRPVYEMQRPHAPICGTWEKHFDRAVA